MTTTCGADTRSGRLCTQPRPCPKHGTIEDEEATEEGLHEPLCGCQECQQVREARDGEADAVRHLLRYHLVQ